MPLRAPRAIERRTAGGRRQRQVVPIADDHIAAHLSNGVVADMPGLADVPAKHLGAQWAHSGAPGKRADVLLGGLPEPPPSGPRLLRAHRHLVARPDPAPGRPAGRPLAAAAAGPDVKLAVVNGLIESGVRCAAATEAQKARCTRAGLQAPVRATQPKNNSRQLRTWTGPRQCMYAAARPTQSNGWSCTPGRALRPSTGRSGPVICCFYRDEPLHPASGAS